MHHEPHSESNSESHKRRQQLSSQLSLNSEVLSHLLEAYSVYVDTEQARFLRGYLNSLLLDFEVAMTRGAPEQLELITQDVNELLESAKKALEERLNKRLSG